MAIKVIVNGAKGRMGQETVQTVLAQKDLELVDRLDQKDNLIKSIQSNKADVVVDFTPAGEGFKNTKDIIEAGAHPVIGTTGFSEDDIKILQSLAMENKRGGVIAPNFSVSMVLMMQYARDAAKYLNHVEIIEMHHDKKADSPSGTAIKSAEMIAQTKNKATTTVEDNEIIPGARGAVSGDIHIHAVRLPGIVAHQKIIFGDEGETFTLEHNTINRSAFMPGVCLAIRKVVTLDHLVYGLEHIL